MRLLVLLYHFFFLQTFYRHNPIILNFPTKPYFPKSSTTNNCQRFETSSTYFLPLSSEFLHLFVDNLLFYRTFLLSRQLHLSEFILKKFPILRLLFGFYLVEAVFFLYVSLRCFGLLADGFRDLDFILLHIIFS